MDGSDADLNDLWQQALIAASEPPKKGARNKPQQPQPRIQSPNDFAVYIESSETAFRGFRTKHGRLWSTLEKFITPVSAMIGIANTAASIANVSAASTAVLNAVAFLVQACEGVSNAYDWIEQVFRGEMQDFSDRLAQYLDVKLDQVMQGKIIAILAVIFKLIKRGHHLIRKGRFRQYLHVAFVGKDSETKSLIDSLNRELGGEQRYVLAATYASTKKTQETTQDIYENMKQLSSDVRKLAEPADNKVDAALKSVLCSTSIADDVEEIYVRNSRALLEGTGVWLESESPYRAWDMGQSALFWIFGGPGVGKSFLSTWLIQQLSHRVEMGGDESVGYFFFRENDEKLRDADTMLKTIAWQLAQRDLEYKEHAATVCERKALTVTVEETWQNLFLNYFGSGQGATKSAVIVIDGLDEATPESRRGFLRLLHVLSMKSVDPPSIRIAIVGRPSLRGDTYFDPFEKGCIVEVSRDKNKWDIDQYIKKRLQDVQVLSEMRKVKPDGLKKANAFGSSVLKKVSKGADGVFLWAKLLLDNLMNKNQRQIEATLKSPPSTLDDMIWAVFQKLENNDDLDSNTVRAVIKLVTYARRPLTFEEIYTIVNLPDLRPDYLLWKRIRGAMSSIIEVQLPAWYKTWLEENENPNSDEEGAGVKNDSPVVGGKEFHDGEEPFDFSNSDSDSDDDSKPDADDSDDDDAWTPGTSLVAPSDAVVPDEEQEPNVQDGYARLSEEFLSTVEFPHRKSDIVLSHTWIRDFVIREGNPQTRQKPPLGIIPSSEDACIDMLQTCLTLYQVVPDLPSDDVQEITDYATTRMTSHLEDLDRSVVPSHRMAEILKGLYYIFGTEEGAVGFIKSARYITELDSYKVDFWGFWVSTRSNLTLVQDWLREVDKISQEDGLGVEVIEWMRSASASMAVLLKAPMMAASKLWLTRRGLDSREHADRGEWPAWLMHGWLAIAESTDVDEVSSNWQWPDNQSDFHLLSAERIQLLASWAHLEENDNWHSCLGWTLELGDYHEQAESHFRQSLEINPDLWPAMEGIAYCRAAAEEISVAIEWQRKAIDAMPPNLTYLKSFLMHRIADWAGDIDDVETCIEGTKMALEMSKMNTAAAGGLIRVFDGLQDYEALIDELQKLTKVRHGGISQLERLFLLNHWNTNIRIGKACRDQSRPDFILEAMDVARQEGLEQLPAPSQTLQAMWMARVKYYFYGLENDALPLLEDFVSGLPHLSPELQEDCGRFATLGVTILAQLYFDEMVRSFKKNPNERPAAATKLKKMAVSVSTSSDDTYEGFDFFLKDYPALLWGRWLRDYARAPESTWRKCYRARLLEEMNALDDDDPTNDSRALLHLTSTLCHANDRRNAAGLLAILFTVYEKPAQAENQSELASGVDRLTEQTEGLSLDIDGENKLHFWCEGCGEEPDTVDELYACEICSDTMWCGECLTLLRDVDKSREFLLPRHQCNPDHDFYRAWPIPEEARFVAAQSFEKGVTVRKEWLENLRKEWMVIS